MKNFISIPTIESGLYMFGGHQHTVKGGWSFFEQRHQVFELMVVLDGHQLTEFRGQSPITMGSGDAIIIAPGTYHTNRNASKTEKMTYSCLHFDFEDAVVRSRIIALATNHLIPSNSKLAHETVKTLSKIISYSQNKSDRNNFSVQIEIEIALLNYLKTLNSLIKDTRKKQDLPYTEKEAKLARDLATTIQDRVNNDDRNSSFNFSSICRQLGISSGYGHRVFKKAYGITPLHFTDREKYKKAQRLLEYSGNSIEEISYMVGAANVSIFSKQFKKWSGYTPTEYRKQEKRKRIVTSKNRTGYFE